MKYQAALINVVLFIHQRNIIISPRGGEHSAFCLGRQLVSWQYSKYKCTRNIALVASLLF